MSHKKSDLCCPDPSYMGCYTDNIPRDMPEAVFWNIDDLTIQKCISACKERVSVAFG